MRIFHFLVMTTAANHIAFALAAPLPNFFVNGIVAPWRRLDDTSKWRIGNGMFGLTAAFTTAGVYYADKKKGEKQFEQAQPQGEMNTTRSEQAHKRDSAEVGPAPMKNPTELQKRKVGSKGKAYIFGWTGSLAGIGAGIFTMIQATSPPPPPLVPRDADSLSELSESASIHHGIFVASPDRSATGSPPIQDSPRFRPPQTQSSLPTAPLLPKVPNTNAAVHERPLPRIPNKLKKSRPLPLIPNRPPRPLPTLPPRVPNKLRKPRPDKKEDEKKYNWSKLGARVGIAGATTTLIGVIYKSVEENKMRKNVTDAYANALKNRVAQTNNTTSSEGKPDPPPERRSRLYPLRYDSDELRTASKRGSEDAPVVWDSFNR